MGDRTKVFQEVLLDLKIDLLIDASLSLSSNRCSGTVHFGLFDPYLFLQNKNLALGQ